MRFKIFWLIFVIILAVLAYFAFPIIKERYFDDVAKKIEFAPKTENSSENENGIGIVDQGNIPLNEPAETTDSAGTLFNVSAADCDNECQNFKDSATNLKYCQQVCGLSPTTNNSSCENKTELEKDYCLKDLAVSKKDFKICDQIKDGGIKKTCRNRITEDIIESQTN